MKIAILDDYQNVALSVADWSKIPGSAEITVFRDHESDLEALVRRLEPFDVICIMRERTPLPATLIDRLPNLKFIASTGARNASIDLEAAKRRGIEVGHTGYTSSPTIEMTWALILGIARNLGQESATVRAGGWQQNLGVGLEGKTIGLLGLGNIGSKVAQIARAFGMNVVAWSQNLTVDKAQAAGAKLVTKEELFRASDFVSIHVVLSARSRGLVAASELSLMKRTAFLINTSRGPIVDEPALINALTNQSIAGAALDVFDPEPLPMAHPFRHLPNVLATPHIGYVSRELYEIFYRDCVSNIAAWMAAR